MQGLTIGAGRFVFAIFAFLTPTVMAASPRGLLGLLVLFEFLALILGALIIRHLNRLGIEPGATVDPDHVLERVARPSPDRA